MDEDDVREIVRQELYHLFFGSASGSVSNGEQDGTGRAGEQMTGVALCQHYGFSSAPPADTERLYAETMAGTVSIAERCTSAPALESNGCSQLYDSSGNKILFQKDKGVLLVTAAGDAVIRTVAGNYVCVGAEDPTDFAALAAVVKTRLDAIHTWALTHVHPETGVTTRVATVTIPPLAASASSVASAKVKLEP
jgi:hypothetical protein